MWLMVGEDRTIFPLWLSAERGDARAHRCIEFLKSVKKGALQETSPMLNDISGVPNWEKVRTPLRSDRESSVLPMLILSDIIVQLNEGVGCAVAAGE
jgi:hypothetical protein